MYTCKEQQSGKHSIDQYGEYKGFTYTYPNMIPPFNITGKIRSMQTWP